MHDNEDAKRYDHYQQQVTMLIEVLAAAMDTHADKFRSRPGGAADLLRVRDRLKMAVMEISSLDEDDLSELLELEQ